MSSETASTIDEERRSDGFSYGRRYDAADSLLPPKDSGGEAGGVKAIQVRR